MATTTPTQEETEDNAPQELTGLRARMAQMHNPGLYVGSGLGIASGWLSGDPLLLTTLGSTGIAASWATLGMNPGPWRWLPGQGEPWEWMCRRSLRGYRRRVRRMRRRLDLDHAYGPAVGSDGLLVPTIGIADGWRHRDDRAALVREAKAEAIPPAVRDVARHLGQGAARLGTRLVAPLQPRGDGAAGRPAGGDTRQRPHRRALVGPPPRRLHRGDLGSTGVGPARSGDTRSGRGPGRTGLVPGPVG
ncbi:hypothetical protein [Streptomyces phaeoluteigriseus]